MGHTLCRYKDCKYIGTKKCIIMAGKKFPCYIKKEIDLPKNLAIEIKRHPRMTIDEFYDKYGVSREIRTDFGTSAMILQAERYLKGAKECV